MERKNCFLFILFFCVFVCVNILLHEVISTHSELENLRSQISEHNVIRKDLEERVEELVSSSDNTHPCPVEEQSRYIQKLEEELLATLEMVEEMRGKGAVHTTVERKEDQNNLQHEYPSFNDKTFSSTSTCLSDAEEAQAILSKGNWYNNGLLKTPTYQERTKGIITSIVTSEYVCTEERPLSLWLYGRELLTSTSVGIIWPSNTYHRRLIREHAKLLDLPVLFSKSGVLQEVGRISEVHPLAAVPSKDLRDPDQGLWPNYNLEVEFYCNSPTAMQLYRDIQEKPYPLWTATLSYEYQIDYSSDAEDTLERRMSNIRFVLRRAKIHQYHITHILNPFTPRPGGHTEMELTVVQRSIEEAYNRAWQRGIRVQVIAATFPEDAQMVEYPFTSTEPLMKHFMDPLGRRLPFAADIFDRAWEEGKNCYYYVYTNADIAVLPEFYIRIWEKYADSRFVSILLREQIPLEEISLVPPVSMQMLYDAARHKGLQHPGDDCYIIPAEIAPRVHYGAMFPAYPPFACFLNQQLRAVTHVFRIRAKLTFHLGVDTAVSAWITTPSSVLGRHENTISGIMVTEYLGQKRIATEVMGTCKGERWCAGENVGRVSDPGNKQNASTEFVFDIFPIFYGNYLHCAKELPLDGKDWKVSRMPLYTLGRDHNMVNEKAIMAMVETKADWSREIVHIIRSWEAQAPVIPVEKQIPQAPSSSPTPSLPSVTTPNNM